MISPRNSGLNMSERDEIYASLLNPVQDFTFDEKVAHVFADMINRSVPGYALILQMLGVITGKFAQPRTNCYDLGCSLGASALAMRMQLDKMKAFADANIAIVAVDSSPAMIKRCRANLARTPSKILTHIQCQSIQDTPIEKASLVVLNFTLQFLPLAARLATLQRIFNGIEPGGALLISEKITFQQPKTRELMTQLHHSFKQVKGYSSLEISQKRTALEKVLKPECIEDHKSRLKCVGFGYVEVWFQCANFVSLLAVK